MEEFRYRLYVRQSIEKGVRSIDEGRGYSTEEVQEMVKSWRESFGKTQP